MNNVTRKKQITIYVDEDDYDSFQSRYPRIFSTFIRKVLKKCTNSKDLFDFIFFANDNISDVKISFNEV